MTLHLQTPTGVACGQRRASGHTATLGLVTCARCMHTKAYQVGHAAPARPTKENAPCCVARRDAEGRLPIGYCSADCARRPT